MKTLNSIGLDSSKAKVLAKDLNTLLANFQLYYQNLRGIHWNIKGRAFFDLHVKFEELYNDANLKVDEIAERILTLGETPLHTFDDYTNYGKVPVGKNISEDLKQDYVPTYPMVIKLSDNDARIIKDTYKTAVKSKDNKTLIKLRSKIVEVLELKDIKHTTDHQFIDVILKDYNYDTQNM